MASIKVAGHYIAVAALTLLLISELLLRYWGLGTPLLYIEDPLVGYQVKPNQQLNRFGKDIAINRLGMRSGDIPDQPRPGSYPILVLGDSVAFGTNQLAQSEIFTSRMNGEWVGNGCRLEVMNASASGWSIANELAYLQKYEGLKPKLVMLVLNDHDLSQPFATFPDTPDFPRTDPLFAVQEATTRYVIPRLFRRNLVDPGAAIMQISPRLNRERLHQNFQNIRKIAEISARQGGQLLLVLLPSARQLYERNPVLIANTEYFSREFRFDYVLDFRNLFRQADRTSLYIDKIHLKPFAHQMIADALLDDLSRRVSGCSRVTIRNSTSSPN